MTIMERARSMRLHAGFPLQFWEDVVDTIVYLINKDLQALWMVEFQRRNGQEKR
jgi:hypothetical protein